MSSQNSYRDLIGRTIAGKIELRSLLGEGGMGAVFRAHHHGLDRPVAIKILRERSEPLIARLSVEARAASRLDSPNVVRVYDFGEDGADRLFYIVMEYIEGETLLSLLGREKHLSVSRASSIMLQVLSALIEAHNKGVIHRDLKLSNIMLTAGPELVKVCDFGLAKIIDTVPKEASLTDQGTLIGTPSYMSPEQVRQEPLDGRSDLYSCGVILYRLLCGRLPIRGKNPLDVAQRQLSERPEPLSTWMSNLPQAIEDVVFESLEKKREDRFSSASEMQRALQTAIQDVSLEDVAVLTPADPAIALETTRNDRGSSTKSAPTVSSNRSRRSFGIVVALCSLLLVIGVVATLMSSPKRPPPATHESRPPPVQTPQPPTVPVRFVAPAGTEVFGPSGSIGLAAELPLGEAIQLHFEAPGYQPKTMDLRPTTAMTIHVKLDKLPRESRQPVRQNVKKGRHNRHDLPSWPGR